MTSEAMAGVQGRRWACQRLLLVSLWWMLTVFAIQVWGGWATRSLSLLSVALHSAIASFSLLLTLLTMIIPQVRHRDQWGHGRLETGFTFLVIGLMSVSSVFLIGMMTQRLGLLQWGDLPPIQIDMPLLQLLTGVAGVSFGLALFGRYQARVLERATLSFSLSQCVLNSFLMLLILGVLWGALAGFLMGDTVVAGAVLIVTFISVWRILSRQLPSIVQQVAIAPEAIAKTSRQVEGILHCYGIRSSGLVGRSIYVEMHLILHPECMSVSVAIAQRVERLIVQHYGPATVVIHIDAEKVENKNGK